MHGSYSRIVRVSDPIPEKDVPRQFSGSVPAKLTGGQVQDLLYQFFRRSDASYTHIDAEEDFRTDINSAIAIARRELFLQQSGE